jgi:hypothetical protein
LGADNQQERPKVNNFRNPQRLYAKRLNVIGEDRVRTAWRHAEVGRNDQSINASWCNNVKRNSLSGK